MKKTEYYKLMKGNDGQLIAQKAIGYRADYDTVDENGENQKVTVYFEKEADGWNVTEESTGLSAARGFTTRTKAAEKLTAEFVESMRKAIKRSRKVVEILERETQKLIEEEVVEKEKHTV